MSPLRSRERNGAIQDGVAFEFECGDVVNSHNDQTGLKQHYFEDRITKALALSRFGSSAKAQQSPSWLVHSYQPPKRFFSSRSKVNQPSTNKPTNPTTNKPNNHQPTNQPNHQPITNQPTHKPINDQQNQPTDQPTTNKPKQKMAQTVLTSI